MGLTKAECDRLFNEFTRLDQERAEGNGLGLSIVRRIVTKLGGQTGVESQPGQGSVFWFTLPKEGHGSEAQNASREKYSELIQRVEAQKANGSYPLPAEPSPPPTSIPGGVETILLVEDEPVVQRVARRILERGGFIVLSACHPEEALCLSARHTGPIHLLIADVVMPGMGGQNLAARLAPSRPEMRTLYISGYTDDIIAPYGGLDSDVAFLQKPFTAADLVCKVREVLDAPCETT